MIEYETLLVTLVRLVERFGGSDILGEFTWVAPGLIVIIILGYQLIEPMRRSTQP